MSAEEQTAVKQLLDILQEIHLSVRTLMNNQQEIAKEQQTARKALGEIGLLLHNHGLQIVELSRQIGLDVDDESETTMPN
jgi:hypothetical protein